MIPAIDAIPSMPVAPAAGRCGHLRRGFTLVELMVVIGIIAVLLGLLLPALGTARSKARAATTSTIMASVNQAIAQFRTDNRRLPGYLSVTEMADPVNGSGFTMNENVLLELSGGLLPSNYSGASETAVQVTVGASTSQRQFWIDTAAMAAGQNVSGKAATGGNYLSVSNVFIKRVDRDSEQNTPDITAGDEKKQLPEIIDAWDKPLLFWMKNETAGADWQFAGIDRTSIPPRRGGFTTSTPTAALFYWQTNAGYLNAQKNAADSIFGSANDAESRVKSLEALLGAPAFPTTDTVGKPYPGTPISDYVLQSAGPDGQYFKTRPDKKWLMYNADVVRQGGGAVDADAWGIDDVGVPELDDIRAAGS